MKNVFIKLFSVFLFLVGLSALLGGKGLLQNTYGLPMNWLQDSLFSSYLIPGLILIVVVGGTHILASIMFWFKNKFALEVSAVAGFGLIIWVTSELYIIHFSHWLQILYFVIGIATLVITFILQKTSIRRL